MWNFDWGKKKIFPFFKKKVVLHVLFWLIYFSLNTLRWGSYFDDYAYSFRSNLVEFSIHVLLVYFNLYFLLPKYIPSKVFKYVVFLLISVGVMSYTRIIITYELVTTDIFRESERDVKSLFDFNYFFAVYIGELYVVGLTTAIKLIIDWVKAQHRARDLERRNQETELSFLRSQLQPHFFFNTLNNLYYLTLEKSPKAPDTVLKLSELMSYVIYDGKKRLVSLHNEIQHIQHYIDLEKLRYGEKLCVNLNITGTIENKSLPPLLLLPFVENSFKHGIHLKGGKIPIDIDFLIKENALSFSIINRKASEKHNSRFTNTGGIGIHNTKRRLELLFNDKFDFNIDEIRDEYSINLKLPLNEDKNDYS